MKSVASGRYIELKDFEISPQPPIEEQAKKSAAEEDLVIGTHSSWVRGLDAGTCIDTLNSDLINLQAG